MIYDFYWKIEIMTTRVAVLNEIPDYIVSEYHQITGNYGEIYSHDPVLVEILSKNSAIKKKFFDIPTEFVDYYSIQGETVIIDSGAYKLHQIEKLLDRSSSLVELKSKFGEIKKQIIPSPLEITLEEEPSDFLNINEYYYPEDVSSPKKRRSSF